MSGVSVNHGWTPSLPRMSNARASLGTLTVPNQAEWQIKLCPCFVTLGKPHYLSVHHLLSSEWKLSQLQPPRTAGTIRVQLRVQGPMLYKHQLSMVTATKGPSRGKGLLSTTVHRGPWLSTSQTAFLNPAHIDSPGRSSSSPASEGETKAQRVRAELELCRGNTEYVI